MNDMEKVEELTKALQEGKTLVDDDGYTYKLINGLICIFYKDSMFSNLLNPGISLDDNVKIQEPEPEFEITENQLAEYECRDGSKAVCYGVRDDDSVLPFRTIHDDGANNLVDIDGKVHFHDKEEEPKDLVRKIRDL